ncbi:MAG TPA: hypothetical protein VJN21_04855 [Candidatus Acidoferrales bacterium]|nr:hypothetical protein [Candidatus Acidoferrales bacterium]
MSQFMKRAIFYIATFLILVAAVNFLSPLLALAQQYPAKMYQELRWREIGPLRGGRTRAVAGVPSQPNIFYIGAVNGGVWKTNDFGRTWRPIFDNEPTGSIGAIAVAPSDPNIVYVGSGEGLQRPDLSTGDGIYKSTDAGRTWTHLGLRDGLQIPQLAIDPRDPNRLFVAVLGHPYGANRERGIFRSTDGGQTFEKVLYKDEYTGGSDVELDPSNADIVYASLWQAQQGPWENSEWSGTSGGLFKSIDGGNTWRQLSNGLPEGVEQIDVAIAPSNSSRIYATVAVSNGIGIYRSDDAGQSWAKITADRRPANRIGGGDLPVPKVDPKNPDIVYVTSTVTWKSIDVGTTWTGLRGAPGGDDYQNIWINPNNSEIILLGSDQGAIITVNGGETWSSWYNQPTAQVYHVNTDNDFPYRVCSGQQESGSACVSSRGNWGEITERDWLPAGGEEYGYLVPDPLNPNIVHGGKISRFDRSTGQVSDVSPKPLRDENYRAVRTQPIVFSPVNPHILYFAANTLWQTSDDGEVWKQISPDLSRKTWEVPASVGKYSADPSAKPADRGVIYAVSPSPLDINRIWAGTDDGLIWVTTDGGAKWNNVTPPELVPWAKVSIIDAGHFDAETAYAAVNTLRLDQLHPHIYRTHDGGKTWKEIVNGIPDGAAINVVREDPKRKGLLFAGSEREVFVSFDDGDNWQSLRLNMPATSVRDLEIKGDDLIAGTHGRGFWALDDITPLRQLDNGTTNAAAYLFRPEVATRARWDVNTDTPLPPDEPSAQNPPDGAIIDYYLGSAASGPVTLEILDATGKLVRRYASTDKPDVNMETLGQSLAVPTYWMRPPQILSAEAGMHRFLWDMHYAPSAAPGNDLPMRAVPEDTPFGPSSPWVLPGRYTVRLAAHGKAYSQPLIIRMDPRVKTPIAGLKQQLALSMQLYDGADEVSKATNQLQVIREQLKARSTNAGQGPLADDIAATYKKAEELGGSQAGMFAFFRRGTRGPDTLTSLRFGLLGLMDTLQGADVAPTSAQVAAVSDRVHALAEIMRRWKEFQSQDLTRLNAELTKANLPAVTLASGPAGAIP